MAGTSWPTDRPAGERKAQRALIRLDGHSKTVEVHYIVHLTLNSALDSDDALDSALHSAFHRA